MTSEIPYADLPRMLAPALSFLFLLILLMAIVLDLFVIVGMVSETRCSKLESLPCASAPNLSLSLSIYLGGMTKSLRTFFVVGPMRRQICNGFEMVTLALASSNE